MNGHDDPDDPGSDPADEFDVEITEEGDPDLPVASATISDAEYLGSYESVPAYLRAMLEPEVSPACAWILEHLDYAAIRRRWESDGSRLVSEHGHVYRRQVRPTEA